MLLICCVYEKRTQPNAAKDLYVGPLFERSRRYAEQQHHPWFILSGEHGLVRPDDWLAPYDTDLNDMSHAYRCAWGGWVVAKLSREFDGLEGALVEIHAPSGYVEPITAPLAAAGAQMTLPLANVSWEYWPDWYDGHSPAAHPELGVPKAMPSVRPCRFSWRLGVNRPVAILRR